MEPEARHLEQWLLNGSHGKMSYMENHFDLRIDPTKLVPGAKSVISLSYNYYTPTVPYDPEAPKISMYAYGEDYHKILRRKLKLLLQQIQDLAGSVQGRCFVDSAPVLERDWAKRGGLGWIGKHTLLLSKKKGSYFFLAELIIDLDLEVDHPVDNHCGTCTKCIDACPTEAIAPGGYILEANKCISYLTIELKDAIPASFEGSMDNWIFGCDICQDVCPWNRFSTPHKETAFTPSEDLLSMRKRDWDEITEEVFNKLFEKSAVRRTKYAGLSRNLLFLKRKNT